MRPSLPQTAPMRAKCDKLGQRRHRQPWVGSLRGNVILLHYEPSSPWRSPPPLASPLPVIAALLGGATVGIGRRADRAGLGFYALGDALSRSPWPHCSFAI